LLVDFANALDEKHQMRRRSIRIIIPSYAVERYMNQTEEHPELRAFTRILRGSDSPRIRLLVFDTRKAVVHLPVGHDQHDSDLSSNYAAVLTDPARVSEVRNWFDAIWTDSVELGDY
jgi:hypothetical protein